MSLQFKDIATLYLFMRKRIRNLDSSEKVLFYDIIVNLFNGIEKESDLNTLTDILLGYKYRQSLSTMSENLIDLFQEAFNLFPNRMMIVQNVPTIVKTLQGYTDREKLRIIDAGIYLYDDFVDIFDVTDLTIFNNIYLTFIAQVAQSLLQLLSIGTQILPLDLTLLINTNALVNVIEILYPNYVVKTISAQVAFIDYEGVAENEFSIIDHFGVIDSECLSGFVIPSHINECEIVPIEPEFVGQPLVAQVEGVSPSEVELLCVHGYNETQADARIAINRDGLDYNAIKVINPDDDPPKSNDAIYNPHTKTFRSVN